MARENRLRIWLFILFVLTALRLDAASTTPDSNKNAEDFKVILRAVHTTVKLGEPVLVNLSMKYTGREPSTYDSQSVAENGGFCISGPDGAALAYIGGTCQTFGMERTIRPGETVSLRESVILSNDYLFQKPGDHTVQFMGAFGGCGTIPFPASNRVVITVEPGEMPLGDKLISQILPVLPKGWLAVKFPGWAEVEPAHRRKVHGGEVCLESVPSSGLIADVSRVTIWQTDERAKLLSHSERQDGSRNAVKYFPNGPAVYLGKGAFGYLYVYTNLRPRGTPDWEDPVATLRAALVRDHSTK